MNEFDEECLNVFLENQSQLFEEAVAETLEDAEAWKKKEWIFRECLMRNWKKQQKCSRFRTEDI